MFRRGTFSVWRRNFLYFRYNIWVSILWVVVEPLLFLYAIGYGLGGYVGEINGMSYAEFFFPALMMATSMLVSFYETTYSSYTKLTHQQTFTAILLTPIMPRDIGFGEIWWAASKGLLSATGVAVAAFSQGLIGSWTIFPALCLAFLTAWIFAAFGLLITTFAKNYDWFIYTQTGVLMPIYFFSGTYFPIATLPMVIQKVIWISPLTHAVSGVRLILSNDWNITLGINILVLLGIGWIFTELGLRRLENRLIS